LPQEFCVLTRWSLVVLWWPSPYHAIACQNISDVEVVILRDAEQVEKRNSGEAAAILGNGLPGAGLEIVGKAGLGFEMQLFTEAFYNPLLGLHIFCVMWSLFC